MSIKIEILQSRHAEAYRQLRLLSFQEAPFAFSESYEDEVKKGVAIFAQDLQPLGNPPEQFVLGVFTPENKLIGIATFKRDQRSKARHKGMIYAMYVHPDFRKQQIGRKLIEQIIERATAMDGMEAVHLWVLHSGTSASGFYKKLGFKSQGLVKNDLKLGDQYIDAEYMVRYL